MDKRTSIIFGSVVLVGLMVSTVLAAPPVPSDKQLPPGFSVAANQSRGTTIVLDAVKPNATKPKIAVDTDIHLKFTWRPSPGFARVVELMAASPEDPASDQMTIKDEPAGKSRLKGGVLTFRKKTVLQVGTSGPPWITYDGVWVAAVDEGMMSISVSNYAGNKADIQPWIEAWIPGTAGK